MGYRSSVYFQIPEDQWENLRTFINEARGDEDDPLVKDVDEFLDMMRQNQFPDRHIYFHDYIKWYTDDRVIRAVEEAVKSLDHYTFIRVGEDADDIDWWDDSPETEWIRCSGVTCAGTMDAINMGTYFFENIEKAPSDVRKKAIEKLDEILGRLIEAEGGIGVVPDTSDFKEDE